MDGIQPNDVVFFSVLARCGSLGVAARELRVSTAAVSARLAQLEKRIGVTLVNRTTRRLSLTPEGEVFHAHARRIVAELDTLNESIGSSTGSLRGLLRVNASLGFGRLHVAPVVARYVAAWPDVDVRLMLSVNPPALTDDQFDVCVRFGRPEDASLIARRLLPNRRLLCAAPAYLEKKGMPQVPEDLRHHQCITLLQGRDTWGVWRLSREGRCEGDGSNPSGAQAMPGATAPAGEDADPTAMTPAAHGGMAAGSRTGQASAADESETVAVKVGEGLSTNDGAVAVQWALAGLGILMRAEWDVIRYLNSGELVHVLPGYRTPDADVYAVWPERHRHSPRVRTFVEELSRTFSALASSA
ncbi:MAG: LysR family transcriptional regulator [Lautropia sp.]|nr:LysR family transcriptional regulator [Lautropia sp.]